MYLLNAGSISISLCFLWHPANTIRRKRQVAENSQVILACGIGGRVVMLVVNVLMQSVLIARINVKRLIDIDPENIYNLV